MIHRRIDSCRRRTRGNWWYSRGESTLAVQLYRRALDVLDEAEGGISEPTPTGEMPETSPALHLLLEERLRVHNNMAAAQLRAGAYDAALQVFTFICYMFLRLTRDCKIKKIRIGRLYHVRLLGCENSGSGAGSGCGTGGKVKMHIPTREKSSSRGVSVLRRVYYRHI